MIELIKYVINRFAEKPEEIEYDIVEDGANVSVTVTLASSDMGKVIGRQPIHQSIIYPRIKCFECYAEFFVKCR